MKSPSSTNNSENFWHRMQGLTCTAYNLVCLSDGYVTQTTEALVSLRVTHTVCHMLVTIVPCAGFTWACKWNAICSSFGVPTNDRILKQNYNYTQELGNLSRRHTAKIQNVSEKVPTSFPFLCAITWRTLTRVVFVPQANWNQSFSATNSIR